MTAAGYYTMTGLGTPDGSAFISGLRSANTKRRQSGHKHPPNG